MDASALTLTFAASLTILFVWRRRQVMDLVQEATDRFRGGGPPTPMHPSPAGDDALLRARSKKIAS